MFTLKKLSNLSRFSSPLLISFSATCAANALTLDAVTTGNVEEVTVTAFQAYRGDVPLKDLPQAVQVLDSETLADLSISRYQDALNLSASIARQNNAGGMWDSYSLRGFPGNENMPSGYLINGFNGGRGFSGSRDTSNIERIEILKGPGSALYGRSDPGGTINIITRKPEFETEGYVKLSAGNFNQQRAEGDVTTAVSDNLAVRINGAIQDDESFRDYVTNEKTVITPSILYRIDDQQKILYEYEKVSQEQAFDRGIIVLNGDFNTVKRETFLGEPNDGPIKTDATGHQLSYQYQINDKWALNSGISYRESTLEGFASEAELSRSRQSVFDDGKTLTRQRRYRDFETEDTSGRMELNGSFTALNFTHHLLAGVDAYNYELHSFMSRYRGAKGSYAINIQNPLYGIATAGALTPLYNNIEKQKGSGAYLQDQIDVSAHWKLLLGARVDQYEQNIVEKLKTTSSNSDDTHLSPRAGIVYEWNQSISFYGSYSEGFSPLTGADFSGKAFAPEESEAKEVGAKITVQNWVANIAIFDAKKSNILTADPLHSGFSAPLGEASSRGVEFDITGQVSNTLTLNAAYTYLDTQTEQDSINIDWGTLIAAGSQLVNVPRHSVRLMAKQDLMLFGNNASIGARASYSSQRLGDTVNPNYQLPSYTLASLFSSLYLQKQLRAEIVLDNIFDEFYVQNSYSPLWTQPGEPRSIRVGLRYGF